MAGATKSIAHLQHACQLLRDGGCLGGRSQHTHSSSTPGPLLRPESEGTGLPLAVAPPLPLPRGTKRSPTYLRVNPRLLSFQGQTAAQHKGLWLLIVQWQSTTNRLVKLVEVHRSLLHPCSARTPCAQPVATRKDRGASSCNSALQLFFRPVLIL